MRIIDVTHPNGHYPIYLAENSLSQTGPQLAELGYRGRCALITNAFIGRHHAEPVLKSLRESGFEPIRIDLPDGEQFKTLETVAALYGRLVEAKLDRRSPILALGGGVLGDTAGFAAATYLRGVPFVQIPTTLLAIVDSSVGGKTGVDLPQGKNLVGAFKQPELVIVDPKVLETLPEAEFRAGLAEVVKHGILDAPELFAALEQGEGARPSLLPPTYSMEWFLYEAINVKVRIVEIDPYEQGRRAVLNLGHTFGHAFERLANFQMRHGEAIAIGIVCAARLATRLGHCTEATAERIITLLERVQLPTQLPPYSPEAVWTAMVTYKKRQGDTLRFILPRAIGDVDIFNDIQREDVMAVLK
jgi:3-dehydroquinate synthase